VLGRKIDHSIANDYPTVSSALDQGRTIAEIRGGSKVVKDMKGLAEMLAAVPVSEGVLLP
jgi:Flp pilus assembly CpaE family ATPase